MFAREDYSYNLPEHLIAQNPIEPADQSRLLVFSGESNVDKGDQYENKYFTDMPTLLTDNDVLFFNNTKVFKAKIELHNIVVTTHVGRKVELERAEFFILEKKGEYRFEGLVTLLKRTRPGITIDIKPGVRIHIIELTDAGVLCEIAGMSVEELIETYGHMPLPPYITQNPEAENSYQTVFAEKEGSVAAPTASLHFTKELIEKLEQKGVGVEYITLHVGLGTFKPIDGEDIRDYHIHAENCVIDIGVFEKIATLKQVGKHIIAVGTTVARTLETLPYLWCVMRAELEKILPEYVTAYRRNLTFQCDESDTQNYIFAANIIENIEGQQSLAFTTKIFIYPGFVWKVADSLITNFHVPHSTLLTLVASAMGYQEMKDLYTYAIQQEYRFFSFGDGMWIMSIKKGS